MNVRRIAVIGGGAAGMMAAAVAVESVPGTRVTIFERNPRLGAKVLISGGGRCNVTAGLDDVRDILARYPRGARWLRHAMHTLPPARVMAWFEAHGVPLKTEADGRVFPQSDSGRDVVGAFERVFVEHSVDVRLRARVGAITHDAATERFAIRLMGHADHHLGPSATPTRATDAWTGRGAADGSVASLRRDGDPTPAVEQFDCIILTTGGAAFQHTGSTGDGYRFAERLAHPVTPRFPSLTAYVVRERWAHALAGLSFADAGLSIRTATATYEHRGPFVFTHTGVSGPAVFALCSLAATVPYSESEPLPLRLNLLPALTLDALDALLRDRCAALGKRAVVNVLDTLLPRSICPTLCALAGIDPATQAARLAREQRRALTQHIHALPLSVVGRRAGEEFVTAGGIDTEAIDPRTMQSRSIRGLFIAGELLNVDGFTGGFNLQAAWATGWLAGRGAVGQ